MRGHVVDAAVVDRPGELALAHHHRRVAGIAGVLVAEAPAVGADQDPALLDGGPGQQAALRVGDRGIALVGAHVAERGTDPLAPARRLAGAPERAEILGARSEAPTSELQSLMR